MQAVWFRMFPKHEARRDFRQRGGMHRPGTHPPVPVFPAGLCIYIPYSPSARRRFDLVVFESFNWST